ESTSAYACEGEAANTLGAWRCGVNTWDVEKLFDYVVGKHEDVWTLNWEQVKHFARLVRAQALQEAAVICEERAEHIGGMHIAARGCADAIRAAIDKPEPIA